MISYLLIFSAQTVFENDITNLLNLIGLCFCSSRLQVHDFLNLFSIKDVMAAPNSFLKPKPTQQAAQIVEIDVGI